MIEKCLLIILFSSCIFFNASSQEIETTYGVSYTGQDFSINYLKELNSYQLGIGVKVRINDLDFLLDNEIFNRSFHAMNFKEHFGIELNFRKHIFRSRKGVLIKLFVNPKLTNSSHLVNTDIYYIIPNQPIFFIREIRNYGPTLAIEGYTGILISQKIKGEVYLVSKIGYGAAFLKTRDKRIELYNNSVYGSSLLSIGLSFNLKNDM